MSRHSAAIPLWEVHKAMTGPVEPRSRVIRWEEGVPLEDICVRLADCVSARPGPIDDSSLSALLERGYDQAPVDDPATNQFWGLVDTEYLIELKRRGEHLDGNDPHVRDESRYFRIGSFTSIFELLNKLRNHRAIIVVRVSSASEYGYGEFIVGLFTISDLNRHTIRTVLYRLLASVEAGLARIVERQYSEPWDWIRLLNENDQARVLGYWEISRRKGVDIGPIASLNLAHLIGIVAKSPQLFGLLEFKSRSAFEKHAGCIPDFRNKIMHPVRPLVLGQQDVEGVYTATRALEDLRDRIEKHTGKRRDA